MYVYMQLQYNLFYIFFILLIKPKHGLDQYCTAENIEDTKYYRKDKHN